FVDATRSSGLLGHQGFCTSALWFDYDRDGLLDLFVCNYVRWSPEHDVFCSLDGSHKSYCTPEAYRGDTCWLFHNRGNGTFEDVTATSGIFDSSSKSLRVAMFDYDQDGVPDLPVANGHIDETVRNIRGNVGYAQPPQLFLNSGSGKFRDVAGQVGGGFESPKVGRGLAFGDFDRDGDLDILLTTNNGPAYLYRN